MSNLDTSQIPAQRDFMLAKEPEVLYSGAFGAGKSRIGCEKGYFLSIRYPNNKGLICRKTNVSLKATTMDTFFRYVCPPEHIVSFNKQEGLLKLQNGSEILFSGLDNATKIGSYEASWIFCDEIIEFTEEDYNMLQGRLRYNAVPFRQIFGATNPADPVHWVYQHFYNEELQKEDKVRVFESNALANPFNPQDYRDRLNTFKGRYHQRFVEGLWISFEGMVYDCFDINKHSINRDTFDIGDTGYSLTGNPDSPIPDEWERFRAVDFGFTNPFVCQWWASPAYKYIGPIGRQDRIPVPFNERIWIMYREVYMSGVTTDEHAKMIVRHTGREKIKATIADHDAGDRALLERGGVPSMAAKKDVSAGIQETYTAISNDRIYFLKDSLIEEDFALVTNRKPYTSVQEFGGYLRNRGKDGIRDPKEDPQKLNDHGMDTMRYLYYTLWLSSNPSGAFDAGKKSEYVPRSAERQLGSSVPVTAGQSAYGGGNRAYGNSGGSWRRFQ